MANFSEHNERLKTIRGMGRLVSTMKMVSTSHLYRAQKELRRPEPFIVPLRSVLAQLTRMPALAGHRLVKAPVYRESRVLAFIVTSDHGLCGAFNSGVIRKARAWAREQRVTRAASIHAYYVGMKGYGALHETIEPVSPPVSAEAHPTLRNSNVLSSFAFRTFMDGRFDEVWVICNRYVSSTVFNTQAQRIFPISIPEAVEAFANPVRLLVEPDPQSALVSASRLLVTAGIYNVLLHCSAGEHAARMIAMDNSTKSLERMQNEMMILRNRARQATITNELNEIVSGSEALSD